MLQGKNWIKLITPIRIHKKTEITSLQFSKLKIQGVGEIKLTSLNNVELYYKFRK